MSWIMGGCASLLVVVSSRMFKHAILRNVVLQDFHDVILGLRSRALVVCQNVHPQLLYSCAIHGKKTSYIANTNKPQSNSYLVYQ